MSDSSRLTDGDLDFDFDSSFDEVRGDRDEIESCSAGEPNFINQLPNDSDPQWFDTFFEFDDLSDPYLAVPKSFEERSTEPNGENLSQEKSASMHLGIRADARHSDLVHYCNFSYLILDHSTFKTVANHFSTKVFTQIVENAKSDWLSNEEIYFLLVGGFSEQLPSEVQYPELDLADLDGMLFLTETYPEKGPELPDHLAYVSRPDGKGKSVCKGTLRIGDLSRIYNCHSEIKLKHAKTDVNHSLRKRIYWLIDADKPVKYLVHYRFFKNDLNLPNDCSSKSVSVEDDNNTEENKKNQDSNPVSNRNKSSKNKNNTSNKKRKLTDGNNNHQASQRNIDKNGTRLLLLIRWRFSLKKNRYNCQSMISNVSQRRRLIFDNMKLTLSDQTSKSTLPMVKEESSTNSIHDSASQITNLSLKNEFINVKDDEDHHNDMVTPVKHWVHDSIRSLSLENYTTVRKALEKVYAKENLISTRRSPSDQSFIKSRIQNGRIKCPYYPNCNKDYKLMQDYTPNAWYFRHLEEKHYENRADVCLTAEENEWNPLNTIIRDGRIPCPFSQCSEVYHFKSNNIPTEWYFKHLENKHYVDRASLNAGNQWNPLHTNTKK